MTQLSRRQLLIHGCIGAAAVAPVEAEAAIARPPKEMPPEVPQHLSDWNEHTWDTPEDLSGRTLNVIKVYRNGTAEKKDSEIDGFAFIKRHCLHCVDPSCVSVCPVAAMRKDPDTGIVTHDPDACIGCRYCVYACPFGVPQYDFNNAFGKIAKCQFCSHLQKDGKIPACCDACPTGASLFGTVKDIEEETARRLAAPRGTPYQFPRGRIGSDQPPNAATIPAYSKAVYGVHENGGTQVRYIAAISFAKLGLPDVPWQSSPALSEGLQHKIYQWLIAPLVAFAGLLLLVRGRVNAAQDDGPKSEGEQP